MRSTPWTIVGALCLTASSVSHAQPQAVLAYRTETHPITAPAPDHADARALEWLWSYPVIQAPHLPGHAALNAWLRQVSLDPLARCVGIPVATLLKDDDQQVVAQLAHHPGLSECGSGHSVLAPREAFANYLTFSLSISEQGAQRPQHAVSSITYDLRTRRPVGIHALFKPDALVELNALLADERQVAQPGCDRPSFTWQQLSLRPPDQVFVEYPYDPAEPAACGDGMEMLKGPAVRAQLIQPSRLKPLRKLVEVGSSASVWTKPVGQ